MRIAVAALAAFLAWSAPALAQTAAPTPATAATATAPAAPVDTIAVPVWPVAAVTLPEAQPIPASFALGRIDGVAPELLSGVTAKGYARKVAVDNQSIGQVLVVSVAKGDREETISTEGMTAQFDAKETSQLFPEKTIEVQGSKAALVAALQRLATPKTAKEEKTVVKDDTSQNPTTGGGSSNDLASGYKSPTVAATPQTTTDEPTVDTRTTTEGCPVRIDVAQGRAFRQSKTQTFTDGALSADGQCSDSEVSFALQKSYLSCSVDVVDLAGLKAWPQYSLYYIDDSGENHPVGECTQDTETVYTIAEDESQCAMFLDFSTSQAVPQAALVYLNRNNARIEARGCDTSTKSAAVAMTESAANCSMRHDFAGAMSHELSMWTYVRGGVTYQAAPCADDGRTFPHETVYADAGGNYICTPITNLTTKTVTLQSRKRITVDGVAQYITECTPDTSSSAIMATTDGCMEPSQWTHDLDAGVSYGQERFYYLKPSGVREYVAGCQTSAVTYAHDVTVTGYQHHDDQLWSYPLSTVTISVNGSTYTVASSTVVPGAPQVSYLPNGTTTQATGQSSYEGCNAYRLTANYQRWDRPDDTEYLKNVGAGLPIGPTNVCTASGGMSAAEWNKVAGSDASYQCGTHYQYETWAGEGQVLVGTWPIYCQYADYTATHVVIREDGTTISSLNSVKREQPCTEYAGSCTQNPTAGAVATWRAQLGW
ncbi:hypothetical protein [Magnetospirillum sp. UT-4]|uniref:hypothetical protein n=1 Tax=Magnetospirillum sp. UT-4 TaxID=2681467 RepID=UPI0013841200|nr:hypothetical protein [Magnetospirillum sp. UT-4]CAA7619307.1 conserved exported hypothetical protein [Magnetospirillum sp. UT-4]